MATAELITDKEIGAPRLRTENGVLKGTQRYWVDTDDPALALATAPGDGFAWSQALPDLVVIDRETEYDGGADAESNGRTIVTLEFSEPGLEVLPPPLVGTKFTRISYRDLCITEDFDAAGTPEPVKPPDGAEIEQGMLVASVYVYTALGDSIDLARIASLTRNKNTNAGNLVIPALVGQPIGNVIGFGPKEVRYLGWNHDRRGQAIEQIHELALAPDHLLEWWRKNSRGERIESVLSEMYEPANLSGLW